MRGYTQVYTGAGKGKTTAALGLAFRAAGAGLRVFFVQFMKGSSVSEIQALQRFADQITLRRFGSNKFIIGEPTPLDISEAQKGLQEASEALLSGDYDLVILDEANGAVSLGLLSTQSILALMDSRPQKTELVLTGRNAPPEIMDRADLVTEMREVKHYFSQGVSARIGIEK